MSRTAEQGGGPQDQFQRCHHDLGAGGTEGWKVEQPEPEQVVIWGASVTDHNSGPYHILKRCVGDSFRDGWLYVDRG